MANDKSSQISATELELKRRGRRRLIGAITIGLLAVVFLPMIFDSEPKREKANNQEIAIQIPSRDGQAALPAPGVASTGKSDASKVPPALPPASPPLVAPAPEKAAVPPPAVATVVPGKLPQVTQTPVKPETKVEARPEPAKEVAKEVAKAETKAEAPKTVAAKPAESKAGFVVQLGAFKDADNAQQIVARMKEAKLQVFTDKLATQSGPVTRVRVGPFATKEKADAALVQVKLAGVEGKVVPQ
jgi:DedD protein